MTHKTHWVSLCVVVAAVWAGGLGLAREIHVATTGNDANPGTADKPYRTINQAAQMAQPGDVVIVHPGTYREWVKPARGGTSHQQRIVYRAALGGPVVIKGSERITNWVDQGGGVWKAELPNSFFGQYNPYALTLSGGWLHYGQWHHRGDVYLNEEALCEKQTLQEVTKEKNTWCCQVDQKSTTIWANFGGQNPNEQLAEINVRESVFMPERSGVNYITVSGFHLAHSAENWQPPGLEVQMGTIGPRMGKHWIIENCTITNARCVGIILGHAAGVDYNDIEAFGDHIVRNNVIRRCGQAGIAGQKGATRSLIEGNLIEKTNYRKEFGGWETAAIKFHQSVDTVIRGNLIRGVYHQGYGAFGIWMDWGNQGTRISGNIIYDTQAAAIFLEMNHGPILVDNNVVVGRGVRSNSEGTVFAHNLFVDCDFQMVSDTQRASEYYAPHTRKPLGRKIGVPADDKWFNNIFVGKGLENVKAAPGYQAEGNVFWQGAQESTFGDKSSVVAPHRADCRIEDSPTGATVRFQADPSVLRVKCQWVDQELVGVLPTVKQTIEDRWGKPIRVETDLMGHRRSVPIAGPLAELKPGENVIRWSIDKP